MCVDPVRWGIFPGVLIVVAISCLRTALQPPQHAASARPAEHLGFPTTAGAVLQRL